MSAAMERKMFFEGNSIKKMPVAVQAVITFVLVCIGVMLATVGAPTLSNGDPRFFIAFMFIAVLYLVAGLPGLVESVMTMFSGKAP
jgi:hypothetical protein